MKKTGDEGFTLIELLVGINLAFIAFSLVISFYLLTAKFVTSASGRIEDKQLLASSISKLQQLIKKQQEFIIRQDREGNVCFLFQAEEDTVTISKGSIKISDLKRIDNIDTFSLKLSLLSGEEITINESTINEGTPANDLLQTKGLLSENINSVSLNISMKSYDYFFQMTMPKTSENTFKDIEN